MRAPQADAYRFSANDKWTSVVRCLILERTYRPLFSLRLCQAIARQGRSLRFLLIPCSIVHRMFCSMAAIDLPWRTPVGKGILIPHGWGLVISHGAKIGRNVTLFHGVTLGRKDTVGLDGDRRTGYPIIEDDVWIGPNATIVGNVTIGKGSKIAPGAFVNQNVPPGCLVLGNPMSIVKTDILCDVVNPILD